MKRKIGFLQISVIEFITATGVLLLAITMFSLIADEMVIEKGNHFDTDVFNYIASYDSPFTTKLAEFVTNFGTGFFLIPAYLLIIWYCKKHRKNPEAIMVGIVAIVSLFVGMAIKRHISPSETHSAIGIRRWGI